MDRIEYSSDNENPLPKNLRKDLPQVGKILNDPPHENLVVVASFCLFGSDTEVPLFFVVSETALADYFDHIERHAPTTPGAYIDAFGILEAKLSNPQNAAGKVLFSVFPLIDAALESTPWVYSLGLSTRQSDALRGCVVHNRFLDINGIKHVVDGHFLTKKNGNPAVMITLCQWPTLTAEHCTYPLDIILNPGLQNDAPSRRQKKAPCKSNTLG